jgi:septal ring factor EnvC (AmiA/AmiB activator)
MKRAELAESTHANLEEQIRMLKAGEGDYQRMLEEAASKTNQLQESLDKLNAAKAAVKEQQGSKEKR